MAIVIDSVKAADVLRTRLSDSVQRFLDAKTQERQYDDINSISKYKDFTDAEIASLPINKQAIVARYKSECRAYALHAAETWAACELILAAVRRGEKHNPAWAAVIPTEAELIAELPALVLP